MNIPVLAVRSEAGTCLGGSAPEWIGVPSVREDVMAGRKPASDLSRDQEKPLNVEWLLPVPQTDTGRGVEDTKATGELSLRN